jgi:hypothetical protein
VLYSCSQSLFFATAEGRALGTSRAISAMITSVTGREVEIVGKPSLHALRCAADRLGVSTPDLAVVGDDPELEVPMAHQGESLAIAVSTGIGGAKDFAELPAEARPHLRLEGVDDLLSLLPPPGGRPRLCRWRCCRPRCWRLRCWRPRCCRWRVFAKRARASAARGGTMGIDDLAARQQLTSVVEEDDAVAEQAPALFGVGRHDPRGLPVVRLRGRA